METYNVIGLSKENQDKIATRFRGAYISDRFSLTDVNVSVPDELADEFTDWCETYAKSHKLV